MHAEAGAGGYTWVLARDVDHLNVPHTMCHDTLDAVDDPYDVIRQNTLLSVSSSTLA